MKTIDFSRLALLASTVALIVVLFQDRNDKNATPYNNAAISQRKLRLSYQENVDTNRALMEMGTETWMQIGDTVYGEDAMDHSGKRISLSKDGLTLAIGSQFNDNENGQNSGSVRVYKYCELAHLWLQMGGDIDGKEEGENFGISLSLSGDGLTLAVGASMADRNGLNTGTVTTFKWSEEASEWEQFSDFMYGEDIKDFYGASVSLSSDGQFLAIGALGTDENGENSGSAFIYQLVGNTWQQIGNEITGQSADEAMGRSIHLSDDGLTVAIASSSNGLTGMNNGIVRVYCLMNGDTWNQKGFNLVDDMQGDHISGASLSLSADGNVVAVGGFFENDFENDSSDYFGTVKVFVYCEKASQWVQLGSDIVGTQAYDYFGRSVDLSADGLTIAVGAFSDTDQGGFLSGRASVYRFVEQNVATADWEMVGGFIDGEGEFQGY